MSNEHPTLLDLDLARTGEATNATLRHLQSCSVCTETLERLRMVAEDLRDLPDTTMPHHPKHEEEMLEFIGQRASEVREQAVRPRSLRIYRWVASAAAAAALAIGIHLWSPPADQHQDGPADSVPTIIKEFAANDVNEDGATDAIDAYLLAVRSDAGFADAEALMRKIVSLDTEENTEK